MEWWYWLLLGLILLGVELVAPSGFYLMFLGLAALCVGTLVALGMAKAIWLQWVLFSGLSVVALLFFRGPLLARFKYKERPHAIVDPLVGEIAIPLGRCRAGFYRQSRTPWNGLDGPQQRRQHSDKGTAHPCGSRRRAHPLDRSRHVKGDEQCLKAG